MDNLAEISHWGVKIAMTYPSNLGGARSASPYLQEYLMAIFTPGCKISAKLSMRDTSVHTSSPGTHGVDNNTIEKSSTRASKSPQTVWETQNNQIELHFGLMWHVESFSFGIVFSCS